MVGYDLTVHIVDGLDVLLRQDLGWRTHREYAPSVQHQDVVGVLGRYIEVVTDHHHQDAPLDSQLPQDARDLHLMLDIQIRRGLVEQKDLRLLDQTAGDHDLLMLACGELIEVPHRQIPDVEEIEDRIDDVQIVIQRLPSGMRMPAHQNRIDDRQRERIAGRVWDVSNRLRQLLHVYRTDIHRIDGHHAGGRLQYAVDAVYQCGFPDTVRPYDRNELRTAEIHSNILQHRNTGVCELQPAYLDPHDDSSSPGILPHLEQYEYEERTSDKRADHSDGQTAGAGDRRYDVGQQQIRSSECCGSGKQIARA